MDDAQKLKLHYDFTREDADRIAEVGVKLMGEDADFVEALYSYLLPIPEARAFLLDEEVVARHKRHLREWYVHLFSGKYDAAYFARLVRIGETHVRIGLPTHFVNAAISFVRRHIGSRIGEHFKGRDDLPLLIGSCEKILDINLDVFTGSYLEEEMSAYSSVSKFKLRLIGVAKRASNMTDLVLVLALMLVAPFVVGLFAYDIYLLLAGEVSIEEGILKVLGSLLILWAVSELMEEEVRHLRGEGFAIAAFLGLAIAAMIRKILITSLSGDKMIELLSYGGSLLALGIVYWVIVKNDIRIGRRKGEHRKYGQMDES
jgi:uncharacterized membrane protein (DUF373 family)